MGLNTTAPTFTAGQLVTAANLNAVADGIQAAKTTYTPALTAITTNPTLGTGGTITGRYLQIGKHFWVDVTVTFGTSPSAGSGAYQLSLPAAATPIQVAQTAFGGGGMYYDSSTTTQYALQPYYDGSGHVLFAQGGTGGGRLTNSSPVVPAAGDVISFNIYLESS